MDKYIAIIAGTCSLFAGLLWIYGRSKKSTAHYNNDLLIGWTLITIFPVSIIFSLLPGNEAKLDVLGYKLGGAIVAYIFIWRAATGKFINATEIDRLEETNKTLQENIATLKVQQAATNGSLPPKVLSTTDKHKYSLKTEKSRKIGLITGKIMNIKNIDIWVNSENTNMQMSRFYDPSVSATIRYRGAERNERGKVSKDIIADQLKEKMDGDLFVEPGVVLVTGAGKLEETNNVKRIFHVASVQGAEGSGYSPVANLGDCVKNVLCRVDEENENLSTIVFPLLGTGTGKADLKSAAEKQIDAAITYYETTRDSKLKEIYFIAYTDVQFNLLSDLLKNHPRVIADS